MVEQEAVNFKVASSNLAGGAIFCAQKTLKSEISDLRCESGRGHFLCDKIILINIFGRSI